MAPAEVSLGPDLQARMTHSPFVQYVDASRRAFAQPPSFPLSPQEIAALERNGNTGAQQQAALHVRWCAIVAEEKADQICAA